MTRLARLFLGVLALTCAVGKGAYQVEVVELSFHSNSRSLPQDVSYRVKLASEVKQDYYYYSPGVPIPPVFRHYFWKPTLVDCGPTVDAKQETERVTATAAQAARLGCRTEAIAIKGIPQYMTYRGESDVPFDGIVVQVEAGYQKVNAVISKRDIDDRNGVFERELRHEDRNDWRHIRWGMRAKIRVRQVN